VGKHTTRSGERRLKDMSASPPPDVIYYPPPDAECDPSPEFPIVISPTERIHGRAAIYRGKVVDFAMTITIKTPGDAARWVDIARIDCRHGHVHKHQFHKSGREETVSKIKDIPCGSDAESWDLIDTEYDVATTMLLDGFDHHVRVWRKS
jgi:hypothetical protein